MQQEAIEVGKSSHSQVRLTGTLTSRSTVGYGAVHYREGGSPTSTRFETLLRPG